ncbi:phosphotransferase family protein [Nonomuraea lactucae]|uniref:phosphotransferase family protein n=1 Tax=Nonomuraea lactucae TaxID=2249762 RepID=UPI000DE50566|nr:aminoglycoside phosphotransferase family protein [Nonomuraea lactucae]
MIADIRELLSCHLPRYDVRSVVPAGQGVDNVVYEVNGELIVRCAKEAAPEDTVREVALREGTVREGTVREVALLAAVAGFSTLPVPEVVFSDPGAGVIAYHRLPGRPLNLWPMPRPERLAEALGTFLSALHTASPERMRELAPLDLHPEEDLLREAADGYRSVAARLSEAQRRLVERFLADAPPAGAPAGASAARFCHNDLGAEHLLADPGAGTITGVIDWTDAALTDPARDFARIYRDLGPEVFELTVSGYDGPLDDAGRARVRFHARCALVEDLAYGFGPGPRRYADAALAHLDHTFAEHP